jgi:hypothetical protein
MKRKTLTRWGLFILLAAAIALAFDYRDRIDSAAIERWVGDNAGGWAPY